MVKKLLCCGIFLGFSLWSTGCYTVPQTGRSSLSLVSSKRLTGIAAAHFKQLKQTTPISTNPEYHERVQQIGEKIAHAASSDMPNAQWEFVVFEDDDQINAFAMPGGKVAVYTGLFKVAKTDDELAVVIGHEVAHVAARHGGERISQKRLTSGLLNIVSIALQFVIPGLGQLQHQILIEAIGAGATVGIILPYSRSHESEADEIGLIYAAKAGYDPYAAISFWKRMEKTKEDQPTTFLSTHPSSAIRIRKLWALMPKALEAKKNPHLF